MTQEQPKNIDLNLLSEDVRSEAERVIYISVSSLLQRYFVSDQYATMSVLEKSKPFFRDLVKEMTDLVITPGDEHIVRFRLTLDEADKPIYMVVVEKQSEDFEPISVLVRFVNGEDLYAVYYKAQYDSLKQALAEETDISLMVSRDFVTSSTASCHEFMIHFAVTID